MTEPTGTALAATDPNPGYRQPVLASVRINVYHPERHVPPVGPGWGGQDVPGNWGELLIVAARRPDCPTNEDAIRATTEILAHFKCLPAATSPAHLLANMLVGEDDALKHEIARLAQALAHDAVAGRPDAATESALEAYLPFTVGLHPNQSHGIWLDNEQQKFFTNNAALLMLAWLIAARA